MLKSPATISPRRVASGETSQNTLKDLELLATNRIDVIDRFASGCFACCLEMRRGKDNILSIRSLQDYTQSTLSREGVILETICIALKDHLLNRKLRGDEEPGRHAKGVGGIDLEGNVVPFLHKTACKIQGKGWVEGLLHAHQRGSLFEDYRKAILPSVRGVSETVHGIHYVELAQGSVEATNSSSLL